MKWLFSLAGIVLLTLAVACSGGDDNDGNVSTQGQPSRPSGSITVYSGRAEALVAPLIAQFERDTGIDVTVRYAGSAALAATIQEEGNATPADVFWSQDPGPLGVLSSRFEVLPASMISEVDARLKSSEGRWVGFSGRSRVVVYNPDKVQPSQLPNTLSALTDPTWRNRIGWAPTNASFQIMVSAMRAMSSDAVASQWLTDIKNNGPKTYGNNGAIVTAVASGEIDAGLVNHYYTCTRHAGRRRTSRRRTTT